MPQAYTLHSSTLRLILSFITARSMALSHMSFFMHAILLLQRALCTTPQLPLAPAAVPVPAFGAAELASLTAENAQLKKDLKALRKSSNTAGRTKHYCWVHGTCFHPGSKCTVMLADRTKYTSAHLNSLSSSSPPGGKA